MSLLHSVTLSDTATITDVVTRTPNRIDILIQDVIAITDLVVTPRMLAVASVSPGLIRAGDTLTIKGQGFATSIASNRVTINGFVATITAAAEDELTVTAPALLSLTENGFATILVESPPFSALKGRGFAWVKFSTAEEEADETLPIQIADVREVIGVDSPRLAEAEDFNKLTTLVEHSQTGGAEALAGGFKSRDTVGLVRVSRRNPPNNADTGGESLVVDPAVAGLVSFGWQLDDTLAFGGAIPLFNTGFHFMRANGNPTSSVVAGAGVETEQVAMLDGVIDLLWFLVKSAGGEFVNNTELLVEGAAVFTNATNFGNNTTASFRLNLAVSKGDRIELRLDKTGAGAALFIVGGVRVRYS